MSIIKYADGSCYIGSVENNKRHGHGCAYFTDGNVYDGNWMDDEMRGCGVFYWKTGEKYDGEWENSQWNGWGALFRNANSLIYCGKWKNGKKVDTISNAAALEWQTISYSNGGKYYGIVKDEKRHGCGIMFYPANDPQTRDKYIGEWLCDNRHGNGVVFYRNNKQYSGYWIDDEEVGNIPAPRRKNKRANNDFLIRTPTVSNLANEPISSEFQTLSYDDGGKYIGNIVGGKRHGSGILVLPNGDRYVGEWCRGRKNGHGTYFYSIGKRYEGEWKNDHADGLGILYDTDGSVLYSGKWLDGLPSV
ncbi:MAG: hypothetical protein LBU04_02840 [Christensenellaceae bacterium]|jgi:hypothetical protein|nr:hypothetical protein [Christensenellaceae bacterium]